MGVSRAVSGVLADSPNRETQLGTFLSWALKYEKKKRGGREEKKR
jgi:hypothetical protein